MFGDLHLGSSDGKSQDEELQIKSRCLLSTRQYWALKVPLHLRNICLTFPYHAFLKPSHPLKVKPFLLMRTVRHSTHAIVNRHKMLSIFTVLSLAILGISTVTGIITNALIIAMNFYIRFEGARQNACDLIIFTLGLSNIFFQCTMTVNDFCAFLWSERYFSDEIYSIFNVLIFFPIFSSFWFTVCLCTYYCIQILIFTQPFLIKLKQNISTLVPWMLLSSVLISLAISLPAAWSVDKVLLSNITIPLTENITLPSVVPKLNIYYLLVSNVIGCTFPLLLVGISNALIIQSLCAHAKHMVQSSSSSITPRGEASLRAARTVTLLLFLYISFYVSEVLMFIDVFPPTSPWFSVCLIVIYLYSPTQSVILILGSPKLKKMSVKILCPTGSRRKQIETLSKPTAASSIPSLLCKAA